MKLVEIAKFTKDIFNMAQFYRRLLGAEPFVESPDMAIFMNGEIKILIHKIYEQLPADLPPENHIAFAVDDVDKICEDLQVKGLKVEVSPKDYYWGRSAYLRDPDGQLIEITKKT